jgi:general secretion pathway protein K
LAKGGKARRQRGAAVLMALFIATLATLIVTGLFWTQFVVLRTIENQQLVSQNRLLLRGALDWGRAILRDDASRSAFDAKSEPWAQPLEETRLDELGETSALASRATLSGSIEDAQSRFNLRNLIDNSGQPVQREVDSLRRLAELLDIPSAAADLVVARMQEALAPAAQGQGEPKPKPLALLLPQDLLGVKGIDPAAARKLADYVVLLDERTPVNINTSTAWVVASRIPGISLPDASSLVNDRGRSHYNNLGEIQNSLRRYLPPGSNPVTEQDLSVASRYFFVRGQVKLDRANTRMEALVKRGQPGTSAPIQVLWQREL